MYDMTTVSTSCTVNTTHTQRSSRTMLCARSKSGRVEIQRSLNLHLRTEEYQRNMPRSCEMDTSDLNLTQIQMLCSTSSNIRLELCGSTIKTFRSPTLRFKVSLVQMSSLTTKTSQQLSRVLMKLSLIWNLLQQNSLQSLTLLGLKGTEHMLNQ